LEVNKSFVFILYIMVFKKLMRLKTSHVVFGGVTIVVAGMLLWHFTKSMEGFATASTTAAITNSKLTPSQKALVNKLEPLLDHFFVVFDRKAAYIEDYLKLTPAEQSSVIQHMFTKYKPNIDKAQKTIMEKVNIVKNKNNVKK